MNQFKFLKYIKRAICRFIKKPSAVKSGAGFTLMEVIVAISIFVLVTMIVFAIYFVGQKFYQKSELRAEILQNGRVVLERLVREIRQTQEVITALPQTPDNPDNPPAGEIEFQDGHLPSPYAYLASDYYYIRYFIASSTREIHRQYRVYCFDECGSCADFFRWSDNKMEDGEPVFVHPCILEDKVVGEYANAFSFWGAGVVNISLTLQKLNELLDFQTSVFGRNL